jgi:hypothetical protein
MQGRDRDGPDEGPERKDPSRAATSRAEGPSGVDKSPGNGSVTRGTIPVPKSTELENEILGGRENLVRVAVIRKSAS